MSGFCPETANVWRLIGNIIYVIRIVIPILIVLLGTIDLGKAVIAGEDKKIKEAQKAFITRIIYGIAIFFVFTIVEIVFGLLGVDLDKGNAKVCWQCATKPNSEDCMYYAQNDYMTGDNDTYDNENNSDNYNNNNNNNSGNNNNNSSSNDNRVAPKKDSA